MKLSHTQQKVCKTLKNNAADICCAILVSEEVFDLGEVHAVHTWEAVDASQGDVCYTSPGGKIYELGDLDKSFESLLRHVSSTVWSKPTTAELEWLLDSAKPVVVGPDPENDGRTILGVRIERYDFDDVVIDETIEQWFGTVSVDTRLVDTHLKSADALEWWFKHSPTTKSLKRDMYQEAFELIDSKE